MAGTTRRRAGLYRNGELVAEFTDPWSALWYCEREIQGWCGIDWEGLNFPLRMTLDAEGQYLPVMELDVYHALEAACPRPER